MRRSPWIVSAILILLLAGCGSQPADVKIAPAGPPSTADPSPAWSASPGMPSYPILLVDLPRYEAGLSVPPARSRTPTAAERDFDSPPSGTGAAPIAARPAAPPPAPFSPPATPTGAGTAAPQRPEPVDIRYVP